MNRCGNCGAPLPTSPELLYVPEELTFDDLLDDFETDLVAHMTGRIVARSLISPPPATVVVACRYCTPRAPLDEPTRRHLDRPSLIEQTRHLDIVGPLVASAGHCTPTDPHLH